MQDVAAGLQGLGVARHDKVGAAGARGRAEGARWGRGVGQWGRRVGRAYKEILQHAGQYGPTADWR